MGPLAGIYHPGDGDPNGYPVSVVDFLATWSEETGALTDVVCVTIDGALRTFPAEKVQVVDRAVAESIVTATDAYERQRGRRTVPPSG